MVQLYERYAMLNEKDYGLLVERLEFMGLLYHNPA